MRIIKRILTSCAAVAICVAAHATSLNVGYCYGEIAKEGLSKIGNATIEGAVVLSEDMLAPYVGATVTGVRVGLVTADGVENLKGWIRSSLEGENLDVNESEQAEAGWNNISLSGGVVLAGEPLVAGFSFNQEKTVKCISVVGENNNEARWIAKNGKWELAKKEGVLSIELVITSDNLPEHDLEIVSFKSISSMPCPQGEDMKFDISVRNKTLAPISGFDLEYGLGDGETTSLHQDVVLNYGEISTVEFSISQDGLVTDTPYLLKVTATCEDDAILENNTAQRYVGWYADSFERKVLIEEFTTEECPNCPRAINTLQQCVNAGYGDQMTIVAHHVGFYTDWLTVEEDKEYLWFFDPTGKDGTYAPAVMLDRTVLEGSSVPVNSIGYFADFEPVLKKAIEIPSFVKVDVASEINENDLLNVTVDMEQMPIFGVLSNDPRVTIFLIEDEIPHRAQAGISSDSFTHSHVFRACLTDLWGDPIEWAENKAVKECSVPLDDTWKRENLSVVAFVNEYNPNNVAQCQVFNSNASLVGTSGIPLPVSTEVTEQTYYNMSGIKMSNPEGGIYLRRTCLSDGTTIIDKVVLPKK